MISSVTGTVKSTSINSIVVEVGGVGVLLQVPIRIAAKIQSGEKVSFHTYLIVREDALTLYGFTELLDRDFFELLLSTLFRNLDHQNFLSHSNHYKVLECLYILFQYHL